MHLWKLMMPTPSASQALFCFFTRTNQKNREGKRGMRNRAGLECSTCTPRNPMLWFVQAAFKLCCIHHCHEESPWVLPGNEREERKKQIGVGESLLCQEHGVRHQHGGLHHSTALEWTFPSSTPAIHCHEGQLKTRGYFGMVTSEQHFGNSLPQPWYRLVQSNQNTFFFP